MSSDVILHQATKIVFFDLQGTLVDHTSPLRLFDDSIKCIKYCKKKYLLALVTEGRNISDINDLLISLKINRFFCVILHTKNTRLNKADGSAFRHIIQKLNIKPSEALIVGDVPYTDIRGASVLGIPSVRIRRGKYKDLVEEYESDFATYEITSLQDLMPVFST